MFMICRNTNENWVAGEINNTSSLDTWIVTGKSGGGFYRVGD
jgi:hypothetical protein